MYMYLLFSQFEVSFLIVLANNRPNFLLVGQRTNAIARNIELLKNKENCV